MKRRIYLDYNATTPLDARALEAMLPYLRESCGNPSSLHEEGLSARRAVEAARERVARRFDVAPPEIVFTAGGTEGNNLVVFAALRTRVSHVITSAIEHSSILATCRALAERGLVEVTVVPVDATGCVRPDDVARAIRHNTTLISVMAANNETGALQPLRAIGEIARAHGVPFHTDAIQLCGKDIVAPRAWFADFMTCSAHKFYGPKGAGVVYRRTGTSWVPSLFGGHQEHGVRPGTENVAAIVGLAEALDLAHVPAEWERVRSLRFQLWAGLEHSIPDVIANTPIDNAVGNTLNVCFLGVSSDSLLLALDRRGISVSSGAACHTATREPSHVLVAMGLSPGKARSAIRFSIGRHTTSDEIDVAINQVTACVARLRAAAPRMSRDLATEIAS